MAIAEQNTDRAICAVTFGRSSPLGRSLVSSLLSSPHYLIRIIDPANPPHPSGPVQSDRLSFFQTDFSDRSVLVQALSGSSVLFHLDPTSSTVSTDQKGFQLRHSLAVGSTEALISACRESGVRRMVYTGSADVVFAGARDVCSGDESSLPYPDKFGDLLSELRMQVEMIVLNANKRDEFHTCVLRPSNVFGPGDSNLIPFIVGYARSFLGKFIIGNGKNMCDFTYIENVAHANICAQQALHSNLDSVAGQTFFITNDDPVETWDFISGILEALGYKRPAIHIPSKFLSLASFIVSVAHERLDLSMVSAPFLSPSMILSLSCTRTLNTSKAKRVLGYSPVVSLEDGVKRTVQSFIELANGSVLPSSRQRGFTQLSKANKLLGNGAVADILLWKDERKTFTFVALSFALFYWFLLSGRTFMSSFGRLLLLLTTALFLNGILPSSMFGFTIDKVSPSSFEIPESSVKDSFALVISIWNNGIRTIYLIAKGEDWNTLLKTVATLYLLKLLFRLSLAVWIGIGLTSLFSVFIVYEQCEEEIDKLFALIYFVITALIGKIIAKLPSPILEYISHN